MVSTRLSRGVPCFLASTVPTENMLLIPSMTLHAVKLEVSRTSEAACVPYAIILILAAREEEQGPSMYPHRLGTANSDAEPARGVVVVYGCQRAPVLVPVHDDFDLGMHLGFVCPWPRHGLRRVHVRVHDSGSHAVCCSLFVRDYVLYCSLHYEHRCAVVVVGGVPNTSLHLPQHEHLEVEALLLRVSASSPVQGWGACELREVGVHVRSEVFGYERSGDFG